MRMPTGHTVQAATDRRLFEYLPVTSKTAVQLMRQSGTLLVRESQFSREVAKWYVLSETFYFRYLLCALTEGCLDPPKSNIACKFSNGNARTGNNLCHRLVFSSVILGMTRARYMQSSKASFKVHSTLTASPFPMCSMFRFRAASFELTSNVLGEYCYVHRGNKLTQPLKEVPCGK